ncbi:hypothetical protein HYS54_00880 [Candidatus Micrarchaeota archaeon]|nr:hypothetical protein [Candidatus Micrarchaeota archaeon]
MPRWKPGALVRLLKPLQQKQRERVLQEGSESALTQYFEKGSRLLFATLPALMEGTLPPQRSPRF